MRQVPATTQTGQIALISLGSNAKSDFGDVREAVLKARDRVGEALENETKLSKLYRTPAFPAGAGPDFVNAALVIRTELTPGEILVRLHEIEAEAGRKRDQRWGPRSLDLDLLGWGDAVLPDRAGYARWRDLPLERQMQEAPEQLILPHPRLEDRSFVLVPLADVAPGWRHPVLGLTVRQMRDARPPGERAEVVPLTP